MGDGGEGSGGGEAGRGQGQERGPATLTPPPMPRPCGKAKRGRESAGRMATGLDKQVGRRGVWKSKTGVEGPRKSSAKAALLRVAERRGEMLLRWTAVLAMMVLMIAFVGLVGTATDRVGKGFDKANEMHKAAGGAPESEPHPHGDLWAGALTVAGGVAMWVWVGWVSRRAEKLLNKAGPELASKAGELAAREEALAEAAALEGEVGAMGALGDRASRRL